MKIEHMSDDELLSHKKFIQERYEADTRMALHVMEQENLASMPESMANHIQGLEQELAYIEREMDIRRRIDGILGEKS